MNGKMNLNEPWAEIEANPINLSLCYSLGCDDQVC